MDALIFDVTPGVTLAVGSVVAEARRHERTIDHESLFESAGVTPRGILQCGGRGIVQWCCAVVLVVQEMKMQWYAQAVRLASGQWHSTLSATATSNMGPRTGKNAQ